MDLSTLVNNVFEHYRSFSQQYPVYSSMATASIIFPGSDIASQLILNGTVNWKKVSYTASLAPLYGVLANLCVRSADYIPPELFPPAVQPLAKAALGPNLWGNAFNAFFFINNTVGERNGYRLRELGKHYSSLFSVSNSFYERCKEKMYDYIPGQEYARALLGTLTFWNAFQYINYSYISQELQTPSTLGVAFGWTVLLSAWSTVGSRKIMLLEK